MLTMDEAIAFTDTSKTNPKVIMDFYHKYKAVADDAQTSEAAINLVTCLIHQHLLGLMTMSVPLECVVQHAFAMGVIIGIAMEREELKDADLNPPA